MLAIFAYQTARDAHKKAKAAAVWSYIRLRQEAAQRPDSTPQELAKRSGRSVQECATALASANALEDMRPWTPARLQRELARHPDIWVEDLAELSGWTPAQIETARRAYNGRKAAPITLEEEDPAPSF